jgi:hypothetical protein
VRSGRASDLTEAVAHATARHQCPSFAVDRFHRARTEPSPLVVRSRQVRVAGIARSERVRFGPGTLHWWWAQAAPGIDRRGNPPRPEVTSQLAAPPGRVTVFCARHVFTPFHPAVGTARQEEGENLDRIGTRPPRRWGNSDRSKTPVPRSKPVAHASRLVTHCAPSVASGRGVKIPAAGPAH